MRWDDKKADFGEKKKKSVKMSTQVVSWKPRHCWGFETWVDDRFINPKCMALKNRWNGSKMMRDNGIYW